MIGYDDERYHDFGFAAAKLDDALNFIPARLGGVIAVARGRSPIWTTSARGASSCATGATHKSPNSAHGESVFAGLLGIQLGGGAFYGGEWEPRPTLGDDLRERSPTIYSARSIYSTSRSPSAPF